MTLTRQQLLRDLYVAYYCAKQGKSEMSYVKAWEDNLKANLENLCDDLLYRRYKPLPSKCFIVEYPKKREIFAAMFRDRIVHHLYYNWTHLLFKATFIQDSYSCVPGRGTHYGIQRVTDMLRRESHNWQHPCYAMHLDIRGYFIHIVRRRLLEIAAASLRKMATHRVPSTIPGALAYDRHLLWKDFLDMDFICWLTEVIVLLDPRENCIIVGSESDWEGLDQAKSMLHLEDGLGLPIGNLTSQLFSNVYMNIFDQFVKRVLKVRKYGRYVDDGLLISADRKWLLSLVPQIEHFLREKLGLELHRGKLMITEVHQGVEFLGAYIKPWRTYVSNRTLERIRKNIAPLLACHACHRATAITVRALRSVNSYLGIMAYTASYHLRRRLFFRSEFMRLGVFDARMTKITERHQYFYSLIKQHDYEQDLWSKKRLRPRPRRRLTYRHRLRPDTVGRQAAL